MSSFADAVKAKNAKRGNSSVARLTAGYDRRQEQNKSMRTHRQSSMNSCFQDGVDHINVWESGKTDLGKRLAIEATTDIDVQGLGRFRSIFALWVFLVAPPEARIRALRTGNPQFLRNFLRQSLTGEELYFPNLKYICASYLAQYILVNDAVREALIESSDATITNYIENRSGERIRHPQSSWWVILINRIRADLQAGRPVNVENWRDNDDVIDLSKLEVAQEGKVTLGVIKTPKEDPGAKRAAFQKATPVKDKELTKRQARDLQLSTHPYRDRFEVNPNHRTLLVFSPDAQNRSELMSLFLTADPERVPSMLELAANGEMVQTCGVKNMGGVIYPTRITFDPADMTVVSVATGEFENPYISDDVDPIRLTHEEIEAMANANLPNSEVSEAFRRLVTKNEVRSTKKKSSIPKTVFLRAPLSIHQALTGEYDPQDFTKSFVMTEEVQQWVDDLNQKRAAMDLAPVTFDNIMRSKSAREVADELKGKSYTSEETVTTNDTTSEEGVWKSEQDAAGAADATRPVNWSDADAVSASPPVATSDDVTNE